MHLVVAAAQGALHAGEVVLCQRGIDHIEVDAAAGAVCRERAQHHAQRIDIIGIESNKYVHDDIHLFSLFYDNYINKYF